MKDAHAPDRPREARTRRIGPALVYFGVLLQVVGLAVDVQLHRSDAGLAANEDVFALTNPGHVLFAVGLALTVIGATLAFLPGGHWAASGVRRVAAAFPALTLAALAGGAFAVSAQSRSGPAHHAHDGAFPTGANALQLVEQLAEAKAATAKYADISVAKADGFVALSVDLPGSGLHLVKPERIGDGFKVEKPELLLYTWDGSQWQYLGIGYVEEGSADGTTPPDGYAGDADSWHHHKSACLAPSGLVLAVDGAMNASACAAQGGSFEADSESGAWALHVWFGLPNAGGFFAHDHPLATGSQRVPIGERFEGAATPSL